MHVETQLYTHTLPQRARDLTESSDDDSFCLEQLLYTVQTAGNTVQCIKHYWNFHTSASREFNLSDRTPPT